MLPKFDPFTKSFEADENGYKYYRNGIIDVFYANVLYYGKNYYSFLILTKLFTDKYRIERNSFHNVVELIIEL